jgi:hypothetical protein
MFLVFLICGKDLEHLTFLYSCYLSMTPVEVTQKRLAVSSVKKTFHGVFSYPQERR